MRKLLLEIYDTLDTLDNELPEPVTEPVTEPTLETNINRRKKK